MRRNSHSHILMIAMITLLLAACAPENLDITPTATFTETPTATPTPDAAAAAATQATEVVEELSGNRILLDEIIAALPNLINAGAIQWRKMNNPVTYLEVDGGVTGRVGFNEQGGGNSELTFGVFDTPEAALAYWEVINGRLRTLENADTRDDFPQPNAFGGGTYGSDAIFARDNLFLRVSVPQFSSTAGNPLIGYSRTVFQLIDAVVPPAST